MENKKYELIENKKDSADPESETEYMTESEAQSLKQLFKRNWQSYKEKEPSETNAEWLQKMFVRELPEMSEEEAKADAEEIVEAIDTYDKNLTEVDQAAKNGISKESWLAKKLEEVPSGMAINEYGKNLQMLDNALYEKNMELAEALSRAKDGYINMNPNLDGNIAEYMIAGTAELSAKLQGQNIEVKVLNSFNSNSVDVRAINYATGEYQNYQLKFGKDAKATIRYIEQGNYNNQRIIVPSEQLEEVKAYFEAKGSKKTITDRIDAWGIEGKSFTKDEMKAIQEEAQKRGAPPEMDYNSFQTKDLAMSIGKNAAVMGLQSAAVSTGFTLAAKAFKGEKVDADEVIETAIRTGADTSVKVVAAGTLKVAVGKGIIRFIPKSTPAGVIANIASVGIENIKILGKIATGELSPTKGIDQMGRTTVSMIAGLTAMGKGAAIGASLTAWIPVAGPVLAVATGLIGGMVGYFAGSKVGDMVYGAAKKVGAAAKTVAKAAVNGIKKAGRKAKEKLKNAGEKVRNFFGL